MNKFKVKAKPYEYVMLVFILFAFAVCIHDALLVPEDILPVTSIINISFEVLGMVITIITFVSVFLDSVRVNRYRNIFLVMVFIEFIALCSDIYTWILQGQAMYRTMNFAMNSVYYCCGVLLAISYYHFVRLSDYRTNVDLKATDATCNFFAVIGILLMVYNCFGKIYFFVDEAGVYYRNEPWSYFAYVIPVFILMHTNMLVLRMEASIKDKFILSTYIIFPLIFMVIQALNFGLSLLYLSTFVAMLIIYSHFYVEQTKQIQKQAYELIERNQELNEARTKLILSQVSPSFIYDGMVEMKRKTKSDPEKAVVAMDNFIGYLVNMINSIGEEGVIPLSEELELTKYYLECERVCFDYQLNYTIKGEDERCFVPPLSIQPIVESAVNNGIKPHGNKGNVKILIDPQRKETLIYIIDDGIGYDADEARETYKNGDFALKRAIDRLVSFKIDISLDSKPGKGSKIILKVPREGKK